MVALAAMKGKDIYDTTDGAIAAYQEDGAEGLVDFGVDEGVGMLVAGTAMKGAKVVGKGAKKALDAVEDMLPDAVTKAVGKAANSAGGVLKEATAVLDSAKGKAKTTVKSVFGLRGGGTSTGMTSTSGAKISTSEKSLLPGEGAVGTYAELKKLGKPGDNITPHHIPQARYNSEHGISYGEGVAIMMEHPFPGSGGRHRITKTCGKPADVNNKPRKELAKDAQDLRRIYKEDNLYTPEIRKSIQETISMNKQKFPHLYNKDK